MNHENAKISADGRITGSCYICRESGADLQADNVHSYLGEPVCDDCFARCQRAQSAAEDILGPDASVSGIPGEPEWVLLDFTGPEVEDECEIEDRRVHVDTLIAIQRGIGGAE